MPHHALLRIAAPVLLAIAALGCELKTSDADLQYLEPFEAVELESKPSGALGMSGPPKTVWLDPRTEEKYAAGHVPKSINLPFPRLDDEQQFVLGDPDLIICVDTDYDDVMAKAAAKRLMELGRKKKTVYVLKGGVKAWKRDGFPVETGKGPDVEKKFE
jgi:rhodanese-related sulfurtransferase